MRVPLPLSFCLLCGSLAAGQTPQAMPSAFPVATVKPSAPDARTMTQFRGNRFVTQGTTFLDLFKYAYNVHPEQLVGGPDWLRTEKFDVVADPETEKRPTSDQMKVLVQGLLTDRFHLVMHREGKVLPVYVLTATAGLPKLKKSIADPNDIPGVAYDPRGILGVRNATMANLATFLQRFVLDRPAVDQTGIAGHFDLELHWTPETPAAGSKAEDPAAGASAAPGLFTAIREQLGLELKPGKREIPVFVIDAAEQPSES